MQEKLEMLLKQIQLEAEYYPFFQSGMLERIIGSKDRKNYCFRLHLDTLLPVSVYKHFVALLCKGFPTIREVSVQFTVDQVLADQIQEYFTYFMEICIAQHPILSMFQQLESKVEDHKIKLTVDSKAEAGQLVSIEPELRAQFGRLGIDDFELIITIDEQKQQSDPLSEALSAIPKEALQPNIPPVSQPALKREFKKNYSRKLIIDPDNPSVILGREIDDANVIHLQELLSEKNNVVIEVCLFVEPEIKETKTGLKIVTLKMTDYTDSMYAKIFVNEDDELAVIKKEIKQNQWYLMRGNVKMDNYSKELTFSVRDVNRLEKASADKRDDTSSEKRVELHTHTQMSQMDGLTSVGKHGLALIDRALEWGHKAIAVTDHNGCQAFPAAYNAVKKINKGRDEDDKFKVIYGTELTMVDDTVHIALRSNDSELLENTYVVFDFETTGFNAGGGDQIIEIGAVKIHKGEIIDRFDELIDPHRKLPAKITEITNITDEMLKGKPDEETVVKQFIEWYQDLPMVAHNAKFDVSFLEMAYQKYQLGTFTNPVIDTLELSRTMDNNFARHSLSALVKRYNVPWDETAHHRADYDAEGTALVFHKMLQKLNDRNFETMNDLSKLVSRDEIHKYGRTFHVNLLVKNKVGLKNLFKIVSMANTKYLYKTPRILRSEIEAHREGILVGSGCYESEVFIEARSKSEEELTNIINFYDYVEVQPMDCYDHLLQMNDFASQTDLMNNIKKIVEGTKAAGKLIVATGDVHHIDPEDKIYREIIVNQKSPGGGRHPLARKNITNIPSMHFRTTNEMLENFDFLGTELAHEIVVTNPNKIADMVEIIEVIVETGGIPFSPKIDNSVETVKELVYGKAHALYGDPLPENISERIDQELKGIIGSGYDVIYLIAQKLVKKSNDDGYLVGSRGSVGSSFVATMMGITEVNPLPAHYRCPNCKRSIFEDEEGNPYGASYSSGYDLPKRNCPDCGTEMANEGQDMPFATFLGFNADKVPDIDLNFSGEYQWKAHEYTKELFGIDNVYRAGTIGTVAAKTAFGFVKGYCEDRGITMRTAEVERLSMGCTGVKRTTGQHPGGIVVIPGYMDVFDFTPFQYPADDTNSLWRTTHFDYHAIEEDVLKLDILGHQDPTDLRILQDLSGIDVTTLPMDDAEVMSLLTSTKALGVTPDQIMCPIGALGLPELGTRFVLQMLMDTKPKTFGELVKISGLSHGTDVWAGNASELIKNKIVPFKDVIGCRDDIMVNLMNWGIEPKIAFKIMEFVRKGRASKEPDQWNEYAKILRDANIPEWYIESCHKIKYMFPKAHACAYVMSALRIAWFKVHEPLWYYTAYFSTRPDDYDIETMIKGYDAIRAKYIELKGKGFDLTNKEVAIQDCLHMALEMTARGFTFAPIDLNKSEAMYFSVKDDHSIYPPFRTIEGLGDTVAKNIVEEREKRPFLSIEDLQKRAKVSATLIEKMRMMGILDGMDESSQLSLF
ncbi:MAG: PolC-type DNA polymerase III [Bacilli bacterium]|nr:PolC-type DNA polymerase III [Bacilli bacterium]